MLPENISKREEQTTKVVTDRVRVKWGDHFCTYIYMKLRMQHPHHHYMCCQGKICTQTGLIHPGMSPWGSQNKS